MYDMSRQLSVFIAQLNLQMEEPKRCCKIMQKILSDGVGNGLGYGGILIAVAVFRELLGKVLSMGFKLFQMGLFKWI